MRKRRHWLSDPECCCPWRRCAHRLDDHRFTSEGLICGLGLPICGLEGFETSSQARLQFVLDQFKGATSRSPANLVQRTVCKILDQDESKPHKVRYYLERHAPDFAEKWPRWWPGRR